MFRTKCCRKVGGRHERDKLILIRVALVSTFLTLISPLGSAPHVTRQPDIQQPGKLHPVVIPFDWGFPLWRAQIQFLTAQRRVQASWPRNQRQGIHSVRPNFAKNFRIRIFQLDLGRWIFLPLPSTRIEMKRIHSNQVVSHNPPLPYIPPFIPSSYT